MVCLYANSAADHLLIPVLQMCGLEGVIAESLVLSLHALALYSIPDDREDCYKLLPFGRSIASSWNLVLCQPLSIRPDLAER